MFMRVAITGGIACGKSLFSHYLGRLGMEILDADEVTHTLEEPGGTAVPVIRRLFGEKVIAPSGGVDRQALAALVFSDAAARTLLNAALHPMVKETLDRWFERPFQGLRAVVVPLLFEAGWNGGWDAVVCLACGEAEQVRRLMRGRGMSERQARARVAAQMPIMRKVARSQIVVNNDADAEALARKAAYVFRLLTERSE